MQISVCITPLKKGIEDTELSLSQLHDSVIDEREKIAEIGSSTHDSVLSVQQEYMKTEASFEDVKEDKPKSILRRKINSNTRCKERE